MHGIRPVKRGQRAAKPRSPPYVKYIYRIEVKTIFLVIAYLGLLVEFF